MKLYTEEQVRQMFENLSNWTGYDYTMETYSDSLTPIELPSDEDIDKQAFQVPYDGTDTFYDKSFINGAKWMKEQILNQNK